MCLLTVTFLTLVQQSIPELPYLEGSYVVPRNEVEPPRRRQQVESETNTQAETQYRSSEVPVATSTHSAESSGVSGWFVQYFLYIYFIRKSIFDS